MLLACAFTCLAALTWAFPQDIVVEFERRLVNGTVVEKILVTDKQPVVRPVQDDLLWRAVESKHPTSYSQLVRRRGCKLQGFQVVQLSDRFQFSGKDYLALDSDTNSWIVLVPEAHELKLKLKLEGEDSLAKGHLREDCEDLIKKMNNTQEKDVAKVMAPILVFLFLVIIVVYSCLVFKRHGQHPGGVLGSIIHYSAHRLQKPNNTLQT